jgi:hypothetical protein
MPEAFVAPTQLRCRALAEREFLVAALGDLIGHTNALRLPRKMRRSFRMSVTRPSAMPIPPLRPITAQAEPRIRPR